MSAILVTGLVGLSKITRRVGISLQHALDALEILDRQQGMRDAELRQQMLHDVARGTVRLDEGENVIALLAQGQQARGDGRDAGSRQQTVIPALQLREQKLQLLQRRVRRDRE